MTWFRNAREKWDQSPVKGILEGTPNPYYQELNNKENKNFLSGYDWGAECAADTFFNNLDIYADEFKAEGFDVYKVDENIIASDIDYRDYAEGEIQKMTPETRLVLLITSLMSEYIEMCRDEVNTALIEQMDQEDYEKNFAEIYGKYPGGE